MKKLHVDFIVGKEVTEEKYYHMLECVPPKAQVINGFLVGEAYDHLNGRPRYEMYFTRKGSFFCAGLATWSDFECMIIPETHTLVSKTLSVEKSLLESVQAKDEKAQKEWLKRAEAGEIMRIM